MHHTKSLDAFDEVLLHVHGAWRWHYGANQPVWWPQLPGLIPHIELMHEPMRHNSTAGKHCVLDMHHTKSLDAFDEVLLRVHGAWRWHYGANQPVWWPQLPDLIPHIELMHEPKRHNSTAGEHCVLDLLYTSFIFLSSNFMVNLQWLIEIFV